MISQIQLLAAIWTEIERQEVQILNERQQNVIIEAANMIVDAVGRPHVPADPGSGLAKWLGSDDTGLSSRYMAHVLGGSYLPHQDSQYDGGKPRPHDPGDFGRCVGLLDAAPELREHLPRLLDPKHGRVWNGLAARWAELEAMWREDLPTGKSQRLYDIIRGMDFADGDGGLVK